jgi:glycosyltransferase involved in cell wall biosynthesis
MFGIKTVLTYHGINYLHQKWNASEKKILQIGEFLGMKFADRVIVVSRANKKFLEEKHARKDLVYIPNGVSLSEIIAPGDTLSTYGIKAGRYAFIACRFVPEKGLHDLVKAYKMIENREFKLVIAGDADHETEYSRRLKQEAEEAGVILTGFLSGKPLEELYSNAGLFVLPSYHEGLPIVVLEALSYGLPVLLSDIPPHREIALPEFRYFKVGDTDALSGKMQALMQEGISREEQEAHKEALSRDYNWDRIAEATYNLFSVV